MRIEPGDIHELKPIIAEAVRATLAEMAEHDARLPSARLAMKEAEAAEALGVQRYVLRDCRRRGEIKARKVGKSYVYSIDALRAFLGDVEAR